MGSEGGDVVQLKAADLQYIIFLWLLGDHTGKAMAYIASYPYGEASLL